MRHVIAIMALLSIAAVASAEPVRCTQGELVRKIAVVESNPGQPVPCEVLYDKVSEGDSETPWRAEHDGTFCEDKAASLVTRLESLGWQCRAEAPTLADSAPSS